MVVAEVFSISHLLWPMVLPMHLQKLKVRAVRLLTDCRRFPFGWVRFGGCGEYFNQKFLGEYEHFPDVGGDFRADDLAHFRQSTFTADGGDFPAFWRRSNC